MKKPVFICAKETIHNGKRYQAGQAWDGDLPAPPIGICWSIRQSGEQPGQQFDGAVVGSSQGTVFWKDQPARPRAEPMSPAELAAARVDPYNLHFQEAEEAASAPAPEPPPAPVEKSKPVKPTVALSMSMTPAEREDPYGLKSREEAQLPGKEEPQPDIPEE